MFGERKFKRKSASTQSAKQSWQIFLALIITERERERELELTGDLGLQTDSKARQHMMGDTPNWPTLTDNVHLHGFSANPHLPHDQ